jgi:uncharacterized protein (TIGR00369 family)
MQTEAHFAALEEMYHSAPINKVILHRLAVAQGEATLTWEVDAHFFHAAGSLHGSGYFKMLDDAAFFACSSLEREVFMLTTRFELEFLRRVTGGRLVAKGKVTQQATDTMEAESELMDENGKVVARGRGTFVRSRILLSTVEAYRLP